MADKYATEPMRIGEGRLSFVFVYEKAKDKETGAETKFETTLLLPPDYDTKPILDMLWMAWHLRWGKDPKKWPVGTRLNPLRMPEDVIRDAGEKTKFAGYLPGWKFISARSDYQPTVRDRTKPRVLEDGVLRFPILPKEEKDDCYAGRWAYISANAYSYSNKTTGVSLGLNGILLGRNDTRLSGGSGASSNKSFDDVADELVEGVLD